MFYDCTNFQVNRSISSRDLRGGGGGGQNAPPPPPPMDSSPQNNPMGLGLKKNWTLMSVLYDDVRMGHKTARNIKVLKCMRSLSIYMWLNKPLNKQSGWPFILTQQSIASNEYSISGHLPIFSFLEHLIVLLNFSGLNFYTLCNTLTACRDM